MSSDLLTTIMVDDFKYLEHRWHYCTVKSEFNNKQEIVCEQALFMNFYREEKAVIVFKNYYYQEYDTWELELGEPRSELPFINNLKINCAYCNTKQGDNLEFTIPLQNHTAYSKAEILLIGFDDNETVIYLKSHLLFVDAHTLAISKIFDKVARNSINLDITTWVAEVTFIDKPSDVPAPISTAILKEIRTSKQSESLFDLNNPFGFLQGKAIEILQELFKDQHPQTVATAMPYLEMTVVRDILQVFTQSKQGIIMRRIFEQDIPCVYLEIISDNLRKALSRIDPCAIKQQSNSLLSFLNNESIKTIYALIHNERIEVQVLVLSTLTWEVKEAVKTLFKSNAHKEVPINTTSLLAVETIAEYLKNKLTSLCVARSMSEYPHKSAIIHR